jgi:hypothetical protein
MEKIIMYSLRGEFYQDNFGKNYGCLTLKIFMGNSKRYIIIKITLISLRHRHRHRHNMLGLGFYFDIANGGRVTTDSKKKSWSLFMNSVTDKTQNLRGAHIKNGEISHPPSVLSEFQNFVTYMTRKYFPTFYQKFK